MMTCRREPTFCDLSDNSPISSMTLYRNITSTGGRSRSMVNSSARMVTCSWSASYSSVSSSSIIFSTTFTSWPRKPVSSSSSSSSMAFFACEDVEIAKPLIYIFHLDYCVGHIFILSFSFIFYF